MIAGSRRPVQPVHNAAALTHVIMAKMLIIIGLLVALVGLLLQVAPGLFGWFGHLPGDIRREGEHGSVFIPITSMIVVSIIASIIINLFFRR